jgi:hypothetical protein
MQLPTIITIEIALIIRTNFLVNALLLLHCLAHAFGNGCKACLAVSFASDPKVGKGLIKGLAPKVSKPSIYIYKLT